MAKIKPFKGLRPTTALAEKVATLPYDVCSVEEARAYKDQPDHFYHITRSEIDLPVNTDVHSQAVYEKAAENLQDFIARKVLIQDKEACYYIYQLIMNGRKQTGLLCASSIDDYNKGIIKKHEFTRPEKEQDRINHIKTTKAQTGVVFLAYKDVNAIDRVIEDWKSKHDAAYDFTAEDGIQHTLWVVDDYATVSEITNLFAKDVPNTYIADGHHRAASAAKVAESYNSADLTVTGDESFNYFLTCLFPSEQTQILDYNRVVKDLNGLSDHEFIQRLADKFEVLEVGNSIVKPEHMHEFGMYLNNKWYKLTAKTGTFNENDPIEVLDVSILQKNILSEILNINDPRVDTRVEFVGGIRGLEELEKRVNSGNMKAAFSCYPVSIDQLFDVADSGEVMPPKSTWFEPKTRDGLVVYTI